MSDPTWDGVIQPDALTEQANALRQQLADAAKAYSWTEVFAILSEHPEMVNITRPGSASHYSVLHQAAHGGASPEDVERLIALGAWRTMRTAEGERAVDIAQRKGHDHLVSLLTPVLIHKVEGAILQNIQRHFHLLIRARIAEYRLSVDLRLPELEALLELERPSMWFPVPGMYGGFSYELRMLDEDPVLISTSWSRVMGGGQKHLISPHGVLLVAIPPWL